MTLTPRVLCFASVTLAVACSGDDFSTDPSDAGEGGGFAGSSAGTLGMEASAGSAGADGGGAAGTTAIDAAADAPFDVGNESTATSDGCEPVAYYVDGDGDSWGSTTTLSACEPPASGSWVTSAGDCDDGNPKVNPGQSSYFVSGYVKTGSSEVSFDYDCSGTETQAGANPKLDCKLQLTFCEGDGYVPAEPHRSGPGVDPYCGSDQRMGCVYKELKCQAGTAYDAQAIACR